MFHRRVLSAAFFLLALPAIVAAYGPHDSLSCTGCHAIHTAKGQLIFAVEPNVKAINPLRSSPFPGSPHSV